MPAHCDVVMATKGDGGSEVERAKKLYRGREIRWRELDRAGGGIEKTRVREGEREMKKRRQDLR